MPTDNELKFFKLIEERFSKLQSFLISNPLPDSSDASGLYRYLSEYKSLQGNPNTDISFIATYLAKEYLEEKFNIDFDAAEKPQSAPGLDIDIINSVGARIVAEIKTTYPYKDNDLGAQQSTSFHKDFQKLTNANAKHKFFFLTESKTFEIMKFPKYQQYLRGIKTVLLPEGLALDG